MLVEIDFQKCSLDILDIVEEPDYSYISFEHDGEVVKIPIRSIGYNKRKRDHAIYDEYARVLEQVSYIGTFTYLEHDWSGFWNIKDNE